MQISFAPKQMRGAAIYSKWKRWVHQVSSPKVDVGYIRRWREVQDASVAFSADDVSTAFFQDAVDTIAVCTRDLCADPVDTSDPEQWVLLRDAVIAATRLACAPSFACRQTSPHKLIVAVSELVDIYGRACDFSLPVADRSISDETTMWKRARSIYTDIICGRSAAWIQFIDINGAEAALVKDEAWPEARDAYATVRTAGYIDAICDTYDLGADAAYEALSESVAVVASSYQALATAQLGLSEVGALDGANSYFEQAIDVEVAAAVAENMVPDEEPGSDLVGWFDLFGVSSTGCVANLASDTEQIIRPLTASLLEG